MQGIGKVEDRKPKVLALPLVLEKEHLIVDVRYAYNLLLLHEL